MSLTSLLVVHFLCMFYDCKFWNTGCFWSNSVAFQRVYPGLWTRDIFLLAIARAVVWLFFKCSLGSFVFFVYVIREFDSILHQGWALPQPFFYWSLGHVASIVSWIGGIVCCMICCFVLQSKTVSGKVKCVCLWVMFGVSDCGNVSKLRQYFSGLGITRTIKRLHQDLYWDLFYTHMKRQGETYGNKLCAPSCDTKGVKETFLATPIRLSRMQCNGLFIISPFSPVWISIMGFPLMKEMCICRLFCGLLFPGFRVGKICESTRANPEQFIWSISFNWIFREWIIFAWQLIFGIRVNSCILINFERID